MSRLLRIVKFSHFFSRCSEFGSKVVSVKPIIKQAIKLLDHRDKNVRESTKALFIEIYRWIGAAIKVPLQGINAVVVSGQLFNDF